MSEVKSVFISSVETAWSMPGVMQASKNLKEGIIFAYFSYQTVKHLTVCLTDFFQVYNLAKFDLIFRDIFSLQKP